MSKPVKSRALLDALLAPPSPGAIGTAAAISDFYAARAADLPR